VNLLEGWWSLKVLDLAKGGCHILELNEGGTKGESYMKMRSSSRFPFRLQPRKNLPEHSIPANEDILLRQRILIIPLSFHRKGEVVSEGAARDTSFDVECVAKNACVM
jgi:hypothetical protein